MSEGLYAVINLSVDHLQQQTYPTNTSFLQEFCPIVEKEYGKALMYTKCFSKFLYQQLDKFLEKACVTR